MQGFYLSMGSHATQCLRGRLSAKSWARFDCPSPGLNHRLAAWQRPVVAGVSDPVCGRSGPTTGHEHQAGAGQRSEEVLHVEVAGVPVAGRLPERYVPSTIRARAELGLEEHIQLREAIRRLLADALRLCAAAAHGRAPNFVPIH